MTVCIEVIAYFNYFVSFVSQALPLPSESTQPVNTLSSLSTRLSTISGCYSFFLSLIPPFTFFVNTFVTTQTTLLARVAT